MATPLASFLGLMTSATLHTRLGASHGCKSYPALLPESACPIHMGAGVSSALGKTNVALADSLCAVQQ